MGSRNGARLLVESLEAAGIADAFGMAGHTNVALLDALLDSTITYYSCRHEQVAAHSADVYYRTRGKPAALILHVGPGLTNAITGLGDASTDGSAIVVIAGDVPSAHQGKDAFQETSLHADAAQWEIARPLTKRSWKVTSVGQLPLAVNAALRIATVGRPGPTLVSIAMDVFSAPTEVQASRSVHPAIGLKVRGDADRIREATKTIAGAERPVILAGGGARHARDAIAKLVEIMPVPVVTSLSGRTSIDELHPYCLGPIGRTGSTAANRATAEADVVVAVGTQFPEQDSSSWAKGRTFAIPPSSLIQIDIEPNQIGKIYQPDIGIVGDSEAVLQDFVQQLSGIVPETSGARSSKWLASLQDEHAAWRRVHVDVALSRTGTPISPSYMLSKLTTLMSDDTIVVGDVGWGKNGTSQFVRRTQPSTMIVASGFGTMGFSAAGCLGAKVASPDTPVVSITGDGGLSSCSSALITAAEHGIGVCWIVLNNGVFQSIMGLQQQHFKRTHGTRFGEKRNSWTSTDFAALAQACGVQARRVEQPGDLEEVLAWALSRENEPVLVDIVVDPSEFPPSSGYWDIHEIYSGERPD